MGTNNPLETLYDQGSLIKIIIAKDYRDELAFEINNYGITYASMFPDLDGLSRSICWSMNNCIDTFVKLYRPKGKKKGAVRITPNPISGGKSTV